MGPSMLDNERRKKLLQLTDFERAGLLRRTYGGAVQVEPLFYEPFCYLPSFVGQEQFHGAEKRRIGLAAAEIVKDGETIALGAGTTTTQVGRSLRHRKGITVVTNARSSHTSVGTLENIVE